MQPLASWGWIAPTIEHALTGLIPRWCHSPRRKKPMRSRRYMTQFLVRKHYRHKRPPEQGWCLPLSKNKIARSHPAGPKLKWLTAGSNLASSNLFTDDLTTDFII